MESPLSSFDLLALEINPIESREGHFEVYTRIFLDTENSVNTKFIDSFSSLTQIGNQLAISGKIREFRLHLEIGNQNFIISPAIRKDVITSPELKNTEWSLVHNRSSLFTCLTQREKQLLCFIYRGYRQSHIAFIYGITIETFKRHRKNIYKKMHFHSRTDLCNWCENFLSDHLDDVRKLAVQ